jgi:methylglutaconyl-CoA hydratase
MATLLRRQTRGPTATLTLDRPDKRNALNAALVGDLKDALAETAEDDDVRTVVLTGAGSAFSAGADLASLEALQEASPEENLADSEHLAALFEQIYRHPKPVIAKINGHAIGGGAGLAAVCDFSLIAEEARVGFTEVKIGFVPAIVMVFVRRKLGETAARDLLLRGRLLSGTEAAEVGLVTRAMPEGRLNARAEELADEMATETSPAAVRLTKEALAQTGGMGLSEALGYAARLNAFARSTDDCQAGISAFLEKRDPPWKEDGGRPAADGGSSER